MVGRRLLLYYPTNIVDFYFLNKIYVLDLEEISGCQYFSLIIVKKGE